MVVARIGEFVRSRSNSLGVGKVREVSRTAVGIEYFIGPGCPPRVESVPPDSVSRVTLDLETRVYEPLPDGVSWRAGRALAETAGQYLVQFPNARRAELVTATELFTRCDLPILDPSVFLAARITETPLWQHRRAGFVLAAVEQRRVCAGMTGLLSSCIDLEPHQIEVVRRVLQDPVQRYLLADEVGLGKTIEAGAIIRQYVLDHPADHGILVLVPAHLQQQWRSELTHRFRLGPLLDDSLHVLPHDAALGEYERVGLVVIDEAHQFARWGAEPAGSRRRRFDALCGLASDPRLRLLLLSATPTLHSDEVGFQALLHLLDPVVYPLGELAGFRNRLGQHQTVAQLYHLFRPDEDGGHLDGALDRFVHAFPDDARLKELGKALRPHLAYGADPDAPEREELVRAVRAHVSEAYRLHRRLLRNRRADARVEGLLPGRIGLVRWEYPDPAALHVAALLDEWRVAAAGAATGTQVPAYGRLFVLFAEAASCDAGALADLVTARLDDGLSGGLGLSAEERQTLVETPRFRGEAAILTRLRDTAAESESLTRCEALAAELDRLFTAPNQKVPARAVVFASYPRVADEVFDALNSRWAGLVVRHGRPGWQHFCTSPSFRVLVCDRTAEEGLNLHGRGTVLVHYDLPWSPNRVEQRIGRVDRFGVGTPVRSVVPVAAGDALLGGWAEHLDRGYGVFGRSVAALQYLTQAQLTALYPAVLTEGLVALTGATDRLGGSAGVVETALREIQLLDELDAVEAPAGHEHFADSLAQADQMHRTAWTAATQTWACETLQFARRGEGGPESDVWRYQFRRPRPTGPSTLMPVDRLLRHFGHVIDTEDDRSTPETPMTYPVAFDRRKAQNKRVALARIGDPFIDALVEYVNWDDRGACAAMWRLRPKSRFDKPAEVAFRFEFVVECPIAAAVQALPTDHGSPEAIRRQADWLFPPFALTVWLDQAFAVVVDSSRLNLLAEEYSKQKRPDGGRDFNLNADRWAAIESYYPRSDWSKQVQGARRAAEELVRGSDEWAERIAERLSAARRTFADRAAQTASRLAFLAGTSRNAEHAWAMSEEGLSAALLAGIERPLVRLDSVVAIFLADWNPFTEVEE